MAGESHVSNNATTAVISPAFIPAMVKYTAGARTAIPASHSVKYIGLWNGTATPQIPWATTKAKKAGETPTAGEITDATYSGADAAKLAARVIARNSIITKAQAWVDRIDSAFVTSRNKWISDAAIPNNAIVGIRYYHPKYSGQPDGQTTEWRLGTAATPAWLRVGAFAKSGVGHYYTGLNSDDGWINWGGLSHGNGKITVPKGGAAPAIAHVIRHEVGHATKSQFKRDVFGPSLDHSASIVGIMYFTTAGGANFSAKEKKILKGIKP